MIVRKHAIKFFITYDKLEGKMGQIDILTEIFIKLECFFFSTKAQNVILLLIYISFQIDKPHDYFCDCIECSNMRVFDSVKYSRSRLNTFRALASPAYMSLFSDDPTLEAFKLSHKLEQLAEIEKEYKVSKICVNHFIL